MMGWIVFHPFSKKAQADGRQSLLQLARALEIPIQTACGGKKKCAKCRVIIEAAEGPLPLVSYREQEALGELTQQGFRLACETVLTCGAQIRIPETSLIQKPVILTADTGQSIPFRLKPPLEAWYVEVPEPLPATPQADRERLLAALQKTYGSQWTLTDPYVLRMAPRILRSAKGLTALIRNKKEIIDLAPGRQGQWFGMAFDVGTTTMVGYLYDLQNGKKVTVQAGQNPQVTFGSDVIQRISFCREDPQGLEKLRSTVVQGLSQLIAEASAESNTNPRQIVEATVVGNTAMHHLLIGLDPRYLAMAPYPAVLQGPLEFKARDIGLGINPAGYIHFLPLKAGFVGSDIIAGILACGLHREKEVTLFLDLGTNGEIVLGNKNRLICCSTAAGPAFEGGHIRWGMTAAKGAVEQVEIAPETFAVSWKTIGQQPPIGFCGSGIISAVAGLIRRGIILTKGNFNPAIRSPRLRLGEEGWEFVIAWSHETGHGQDLVITQKDVAEVQLAKAAIFAGSALLQEGLGNIPIRRILLAGAFGNYTVPEDAATLGLFPDGPVGEVRMMGNTAGYGACLTLLNAGKRKEAERISRKMEYLELAAHPRFQGLFVSGFFFRSALDYQDTF